MRVISSGVLSIIQVPFTYFNYFKLRMNMKVDKFFTLIITSSSKMPPS